VSGSGTLGVIRGAALYVGALVGPGLLLVPALAVGAAGPASILAWTGLLVLSAPLAITFAALGARLPIAGGVAAYVREGLGERAGAVTGACFVSTSFLGAPAVSLIGGFYVADLTGRGRTAAALAGLAMFAAVVAANALGLRIASGLQVVLSSALVGAVLVAVLAALPSHGSHGWRPFAPHGWWAIGSAASILMWLFIGWEAMAQLVGEFRDPARQLPRAMALAFAVIAILYVGLALATITTATGRSSKVPLADLLAVGFGSVGRDVAAALAVALTTGTMNVYMGASARLAAHLAHESVLPAWLGRGSRRSVPLRPLAALAVAEALLTPALALGATSATTLIRATSACFVTVYVLALASAVRFLAGRMRTLAAVALALVSVVAVFSGPYLAVPVAVAALTVGGQTARRRRAGSASASDSTGNATNVVTRLI
jgi:amino acid efflux transporter